MDTDTKKAIQMIAEHHEEQTEKVLGALSELTNWMNTVQQSIENIDKRLELTEKTNEYQDKESEFYATKEDLVKGMKKLHKFTEKYCDESVQQRDFYN